MRGTLPRRAAEASGRLRRGGGVAQIAGMHDPRVRCRRCLRRDLPDLAATEALAAAVAALARPGDAILLDGPFGAGKTAFARAFLRAASGDPALEVPSPSFTLVQSYDTRRGPVHHFDLWRLDGPAALAELGWDEARADIVLVEWPERLGALRPPEALTLRAGACWRGDARRAALSGWPDRLARRAGDDPPARRHAAGRRPRHPHAPADRGHRQAAAAAGRPRRCSTTRSTGWPPPGWRRWWSTPTGRPTRSPRTWPRAPAAAAHRAAPRGRAAGHRRRRAGGAATCSGADPFFVVNGDSFWLDGPTPALRPPRRRLGRGRRGCGAAGAPHLPGPGGDRPRRFRPGQLGRSSAAAASAKSCPTSMPASSWSRRRCWPTRRTGAFSHEPRLGPRHRRRPPARRGA